MISDKLGAVRTPERCRATHARAGRTWVRWTPTSRIPAAVKESPADSIGPGYTSFATDMMDKMCFREFFCPRCGARLATEVARREDDYLWDIESR